MQSLPPLPESMQQLALPEYSNRQLALPGQSEIASTTSTGPDIYNENSMELVLRHAEYTLATTQNLVVSETRTTPDTTMFSSTTNNTAGLILPFNRVQPVAIQATTNQLSMPAASSGVQGSAPARHRHKRRNIESGAANSDVVTIEESIISLLLKLHSQLSGTLDSFSLEDDGQTDESKHTEDDSSEDEDMYDDSESKDSSQLKISDSRIGDGPYFIGNLLRKIAKMDESCATKINEIRAQLWPNQRERQAEQKAREAKEKEERSKRAKERQKKLMEEFANKQKLFMEQAMSSGENNMDCFEDDDDDEELLQAREKEYDCIICNTTGPSTESNPIGESIKKANILSILFY